MKSSSVLLPSARSEEIERLCFPPRLRQAGYVKKVRILLADDHPHFPKLVESLLDPRFELVGKVRDGRALLDAALHLQPDIIVSDISMPELNGLEAANELRKSGCNSKIIFLTVHSDPDFIRSALAAGAFGYVVKSRMAVDLLPAIHEALAGHLFISSQAI